MSKYFRDEKSRRVPKTNRMFDGSTRSMLPRVLPSRLPILRSLDRLARSGQCRSTDQEGFLRYRPSWALDQRYTLSTSCCQIPLCQDTQGHETSPRPDQDSLGHLDWECCRLWSICIRHLRSCSLLWQSYRLDRCDRLCPHGRELLFDSKEADTDVRLLCQCTSGYMTLVIAVKNLF
jgi:hypothetical protein